MSKKVLQQQGFFKILKKFGNLREHKGLFLVKRCDILSNMCDFHDYMMKEGVTDG